MRRTTLILSIVLVLAFCLNAFSFAAGFGLGWWRRDPGVERVVMAEREVSTPLPSVTQAGAVATSTPEPVPTLVPDRDGVLREERLGLLGEAWGHVDQDFYTEEPIDYAKVNYEMIKAFLEALDDPYTRFVEPPQAELDRSGYEGSFGGIGAYIGMTEEGQPYISEIIRGNPAEEAGLQAGDLIVEVDGQSVEGLTQDDIVLLVRGPVGTEVVLTIQRPSEEAQREIAIERAEIKLPTVEWQPVADGQVAHIELTFFAGPTGEELATALREIKTAGISRLILDMRGNRGGLLSSAGDVTAQFVDRGVLLYERRRGDDGDVVEEAYSIPSTRQVLPDAELVLLVDGGTASASEIVAGALQDYDRAILIGEKTFGKGSMQFVHELSDRSSLRVTAAHWLTPDKRPIDGIGLTPEIEVARTPEDLEAGRDPQLDQAVEVLMGRE